MSQNITASTVHIKALLEKPPESERAARSCLRSLMCSPPLRNRIRRQLFEPALFLVTSIVLIVAALWLGPSLITRNSQLRTNDLIVAIGNLIIAMSILLAISKWHTSLEQDAMKQYEVEIAESNVIEAAPAVRMMMGHLYDACQADGSPDYDRSRYVYAQLDNLEYALERYMQGLASAYTTARAVLTFANRCLSGEFQERARHQVRAASYSAVVIRVVGALCP